MCQVMSQHLDMPKKSVWQLAITQNLFGKDISFWESHLPMSNPRFTDDFFRLFIEVFHRISQSAMFDFQRIPAARLVFTI